MLSFKNRYHAIEPEAEKAKTSENPYNILPGWIRSFKFKVEGNITPWILSTLFFAALSTLASFKGNGNGGEVCGYRFGVAENSEMARTDRILGIPKTTTSTTPFTGSPTFDTHGYPHLAPESPPYIGEPSPEIDEAWEALKGGRYFSISEEEAKALWGDGYMEFEDRATGGFTAGLDIFHALHCINQLRKALSPTSPLNPPPTHLHGPAHLNHCLNHLRQYVMCSGDTTPNPTKYFENIHQNYVWVEREHTCREWNGIREWAWGRFNGSGNGNGSSGVSEISAD